MRLNDDVLKVVGHVQLHYAIVAQLMGQKARVRDLERNETNTFALDRFCYYYPSVRGKDPAKMQIPTVGQGWTLERTLTGSIETNRSFSARRSYNTFLASIPSGPLLLKMGLKPSPRHTRHDLGCTCDMLQAITGLGT